MKKEGGFIGKEAVLRQREKGPMKRRLVQVLLTDPEPMLFHAEVLRRNDQMVGYVRAASYGFTLKGAVGLAMVEGGSETVDPAWLASGTFDVEVAGRRVPATVSLRPMYDPESKRIKV